MELSDDDNAPAWDQIRADLSRLTSHQDTADPAALAAKLANRAKMLRSRAESRPSESTKNFLAFHSGHQQYGIAIHQVVEIQTLEHYSPVPGTPDFIVGVIHWRGVIVSLLDLGRLTGVVGSGLADYHVCLIVEALGKRIAVAGREVNDILTIAADQIKPFPELPGAAPRDWFLGVHEGNRLLLSLEVLLQDERLTRWRS